MRNVGGPATRRRHPPAARRRRAPSARPRRAPPRRPGAPAPRHLRRLPHDPRADKGPPRASRSQASKGSPRSQRKNLRESKPGKLRQKRLGSGNFPLHLKSLCCSSCKKKQYCSDWSHRLAAESQLLTLCTVAESLSGRTMLQWKLFLRLTSAEVIARRQVF